MYTWDQINMKKKDIYIYDLYVCREYTCDMLCTSVFTRMKKKLLTLWDKTWQQFQLGQNACQPWWGWNGLDLDFFYFFTPCTLFCKYIHISEKNCNYKVVCKWKCAIYTAAAAKIGSPEFLLSLHSHTQWNYILNILGLSPLDTWIFWVIPLGHSICIPSTCIKFIIKKA